MLCLHQDFSVFLNFRGTFTNSGGHSKSFKILPVKLNIQCDNAQERAERRRTVIRKFLFIFYLNLSSMSIVLAQEGV